MSLHVYDWVDKKYGKIPLKVEECNDIFFDKYSLLKDTEDVRNILKYVDGATYLNKDQVLDRSGCKLSRLFLSTGCKTLLNIALHPDKCFSTIECGKNAVYISLWIKEGNLVWYEDSYNKKYEHKCDIIYHGKQFTNIKEFANFHDLEA